VVKEEGSIEEMSGGGGPAAASQELQLPPGFRFHPTDEELVTYYLCRRCAGLPISVPIIAEVDLYKFDPWQLPSTSSFDAPRRPNMHLHALLCRPIEAWS
jgi:hypothetical protein